MIVNTITWISTIFLLLVLIIIDFLINIKSSKFPSLKVSIIWSSFYIILSIICTVILILLGYHNEAVEFFASYLTEKSLSIDNLFVFLMIMSNYSVPRAYQQKVLLFGIIFAFLSRIFLIFLGTELVQNISWSFYILSIILFVTSFNLLRQKKNQQFKSNKSNIIDYLRKILRIKNKYQSSKIIFISDNKYYFTTLFLVIINIGIMDVIFAIDSIPAVFGLTQNIYIIFMANILSLLGLRQLYFLIEIVLKKFKYLTYGLIGILLFISLKLLLSALNKNQLSFINQGKPIHCLEFNIYQSLTIICILLIITSLFSYIFKK